MGQVYDMLLTGILLCYSAAWGLPLVGSTTRVSSLVSHSSSKLPATTPGCKSDEDCNNLDGFACDFETNHCTCKELNTILSPKGLCLTVKQLGQSCSLNNQCSFFDEHATCADGICACLSGFNIIRDQNGSRCEGDGHVNYGRPTQAPHYRLDTNVVVIMIVMAIMFVGMCVALHLFSRARFRNRRTIFNSPHPRLMHIKLGKRRASSISHRRPSHVSMAPPRSRHHSVSSHISHTTPSPSLSAGKPRRASNGLLGVPNQEPYHEAPLAENESLPSTEDLAKKMQEDHATQNSPAILKANTAAVQEGTNSPTVIVTSASGERTVVKGKSPSPTAQV